MLPDKLIYYPGSLTSHFTTEQAAFNCDRAVLLCVTDGVCGALRQRVVWLGDVVSYAALFILPHLASCYGNEADTISHC